MDREYQFHKLTQPIKDSFNIKINGRSVYDFRHFTKVKRFDNLGRAKHSSLKNPLKWRFNIKAALNSDRYLGWKDSSVTLSSLDIDIENHLIWLGHSTFYLNIGGVRIITDPVFGSVPFVKRISKFPIDPSLIKDTNYILISHDHYDHLDIKSLKILIRQSYFTTLICGKGSEDLLKFPELYGKYSVVALDWYEPFAIDDFKFTFLPSIHSSRRSMSDFRKRLWGAFMITRNNTNIYFSGDTRYGEHFKELPTLFGKIDYAIIGIGTYRPRNHLNRNHISPREAVVAAKDMGAAITIPMHYNTFDLSNERYCEPLKIFNKAARINSVETLTPNIGEVVELEKSF